jgi:sortase A
MSDLLDPPAAPDGGEPPDEPGGVATRTAAHRRGAMSAGDRVRFVLRGVGQTLITSGLVVLLFVFYEVYVTNYFAHREQSRVHNKLEQTWANGVDPLHLPGAGATGIPLGVGIANIYIPRLGRDYAFTIVQGSQIPNDSELEKGPAHYADTQLPGQPGNFAMAGHRVGKGEPFLNLDHLRAGDTVIVETKANWYVYQVLGKNDDLSKTDANGVPGREIVSPSDGDVLLPIPDHPGQKAAGGDRYLTMTTCHPKFTANQRMVVHAVLLPDLSTPRTGDTMPQSIADLYNAKGL